MIKNVTAQHFSEENAKIVCGWLINMGVDFEVKKLKYPSDKSLPISIRCNEKNWNTFRETLYLAQTMKETNKRLKEKYEKLAKAYSDVDLCLKEYKSKVENA